MLFRGSTMELSLNPVDKASGGIYMAAFKKTLFDENSHCFRHASIVRCHNRLRWLALKLKKHFDGGSDRRNTFLC